VAVRRRRRRRTKSYESRWVLFMLREVWERRDSDPKKRARYRRPMLWILQVIELVILA